MNISVLGCGRWASSIAWYLDKIGHKVTIWGRKNSGNLKRLSETRQNDFLTLPKSITLTDDLETALKNSDINIISINTQSFRIFLKSSVIHKEMLENKPLIFCMKGIEADSGKRLSEIAEEYIPKNKNIAVWVGPGHAQTFVQEIPTCMVIDSKNEDLKKFLANKFSSNLIRFYIGTDLIGTEIGAAAKNVMGIAAGILDGMGYESLKGALMSRGIFEVAKLIKALGGNKKSAYGLAHLGDFQATLFSKFSNNRMYGEKLIKGEKPKKLAEGVGNSKAFMVLAKKHNLNLPICQNIYEIIFENKNPKEALKNLFELPIVKEF